MKLYYAPGACSLSPHIALREAGLEFELEKVDNKTKQTESGANYLDINPKGYVPALRLDDGSVLTEGPAIVQFIADRAPGAKLAPLHGTPERYRLQEWLNFIGTEIHKTYSPFFNPATPDAAKQLAKETLLRRYAFVGKTLEHKPYLMGDGYSVADAYLFVVTNWARHLQIDLSSVPAIKPFQARIAERPAVQAALKAEGLIK